MLYSRLILFPALILGFQPLIFAQNWMQITEIDTTNINSISATDEALFAASDSLIYFSTDQGNSWNLTMKKIPLDHIIYSIYGIENTLFVGTLGNSLFKTSDNGQSWQSLNTGLPNRVTSIAALGDSLYAGTDTHGIYVSSLSSFSGWYAFNTGLFQSGTNKLATSGNNLVASVGNYLFVRGRTDSEWRPVQFDEQGSQLYTFETATTDSHLFAGTDRGVYKADINGINWTKSDITAFPNANVTVLVNDGNRIYASIDYLNQHYIFSSDDNGTNWTIRAHEFAYLMDLFVYADKLWAGRWDGLWYINLSTGTNTEDKNHEIPTSLRLQQNYPNPFNPVTTIPFSVSETQFIKLKVFDVMGKEIATLIDKTLNAGNYTVQFDASALPSGMYFYQLSGTGFSETKRAVLLK